MPQPSRMPQSVWSSSALDAAHVPPPRPRLPQFMGTVEQGALRSRRRAKGGSRGGALSGALLHMRPRCSDCGPRAAEAARLWTWASVNESVRASVMDAAACDGSLYREAVHRAAAIPGVGATSCADSTGRLDNATHESCSPR